LFLRTTIGFIVIRVKTTGTASRLAHARAITNAGVNRPNVKIFPIKGILPPIARRELRTSSLLRGCKTDGLFFLRTDRGNASGFFLLRTLGSNTRRFLLRTLLLRGIRRRCGIEVRRHRSRRLSGLWLRSLGLCALRTRELLKIRRRRSRLRTNLLGLRLDLSLFREPRSLSIDQRRSTFALLRTHRGFGLKTRLFLGRGPRSGFLLRTRLGLLFCGLTRGFLLRTFLRSFSRGLLLCTLCGGFSQSFLSRTLLC
jgi:hypothetical protein